jgi:hypothetical protein
VGNAHGLESDPHLNLLHLLSNVLIFAGFMLIAAWDVLYKVQKTQRLATTVRLEEIYASCKPSHAQKTRRLLPLDPMPTSVIPSMSVLSPS